VKYRVVLKGRQAPRSFLLHSSYWWVLKSAGNGAVLATSEMYTTHRAALKTATALAAALGVEVEDRT